MRDVFYSKVTLTWLVLASLTGLSWLLGDGITSADPKTIQYLTTGLMVLAFFKVRLVIMEFMEIYYAPLAMRLIFEAWVIGVCSIVLALYFFL